MSGDTLDLPVSITMVVSGPGPPEPELSDTLGLPDFSADIDPGPGEPFPRSGSMLARLVFLDACVPAPGGLCRSPEVYRMGRVLPMTLVRDPGSPS